MDAEEITITLKADLTQPRRRLEQVKMLLNDLRTIQLRARMAEQVLEAILREDGDGR